MTEQEFKNEKLYQGVMHHVRAMLLQGIITEEQYCQIETKMREKYRPYSGDLLSGINLIVSKIRA